ncbi:MAG: hypothetical protein WCG50_13245 [Rhodoferax sp.]|uniref:hypothetical protein n=1 Tax=Rhodoferax sp. TaxID=50421 RepID=UPI00301A6AE9
MFTNFFKRSTPAAAVTLTPVAPNLKQKISAEDVEMMERRKLPRTMPAPEVFEGDGGELDWALWSNAMQKLNEENSSANNKNLAV